MNDIDSFVYWNALRWKQLTSCYDDIVSTWKSMLEDGSITEPKYLKFLSEHAGFFFHDSNRRLISISEFELGADFRADFVICSDLSSYGFEYEFIEIESPTDAVYTKRGNPSSHLTEAINQIVQWKLWLNANRPEAKRILPSKSFIYSDVPCFKFTIIIGRREKTREHLHIRNQYSKQLDIEIRSFDYLTEKLLERQFDTTPLIPSEEFKQLDFKIKNDLANPFVESFKSSVWREMVKLPGFSSSHMIADNAELLLSKRKFNNANKKFSESWFLLDIEKRKMLLEEARYLA